MAHSAKNLFALSVLMLLLDVQSIRHKGELGLALKSNSTMDLGRIIQDFINHGLRYVAPGVSVGVGRCSCRKGWSGIGWKNHEFTCGCTDLFVQNPPVSEALPDAVSGWTRWKHPNLLQIGQIDLEVKVETGWTSFADIRTIHFNSISITQGEVNMEFHAKASVLCSVSGLKSNFDIMNHRNSPAPGGGGGAGGPTVTFEQLNVNGITASFKRKGLREKQVGLATITTKNLTRKLSSGGALFKFIIQNLYTNVQANFRSWSRSWTGCR